jgi:hypothetical protein
VFSKSISISFKGFVYQAARGVLEEGANDKFVKIL